MLTLENIMKKQNHMHKQYRTINKTRLLFFVAAVLLAVIVIAAAFSGCSAKEQVSQTENTASSSVAPASTPAPQPTAIKTAPPSPAPSKSAEGASASKPKPTPAASRSPLSGRTIGLDPGHQAHADEALEPVSPGSKVMKAKTSSGTQGRYTRIPEYVVNLQAALKLKAKLEALGAKVVMTRETNDVDISNIARAQIMNKAGVDCWLRIHANGNADTSVNGMFMLVPAKGCLDTSDSGVYGASVSLGKTLLRDAAASSGAKGLGLEPRSDQTGFNWSALPVCNIEMGYMTNKTEDYALTSGAYQDKIASGLAQGFVDYFGG
jgi:N-acetylmuramoyl-L-alanine amidase